MATARALAAAAIWLLASMAASAQQGSSVSDADKKAAYERMLFGGIHFNNTERVLEALRGGADPNHARDFSDTPPLFLAVSNASRKPEIVKLLIEHGADVNARWTLGLGGRKSDADSNPMLLLLARKAAAESNRDYFPLYWAALNNNAAAVKELIANGADVHARTGNLAMTALFATYDPVVGEILLVNGADINAKDARGQSVLSHARKRLASANNSEAIQLRPKFLSYVRWLEAKGAKE